MYGTMKKLLKGKKCKKPKFSLNLNCHHLSKNDQVTDIRIDSYESNLGD